MKIYMIEMPEDQAEQTRLNGLISGLESYFGLEFRSCLMVENGNPEVDGVLEKIAKHGFDTNEPVAAKVEVKKDVPAPTNGKLCPMCGKPARKKSKYCSQACATKAWRDRQSKEPEPEPKRKRVRVYKDGIPHGLVSNGVVNGFRFEADEA